jgi:hypothetical protein
VYCLGLSLNLKISDSYTSVNAAGLPTPYDLTHDEKWSQGGEFLTKYDLELKIKPVTEKVFTPVKEVLTLHLNTPEDKEPIENIHKSDDEEQPVKVSTLFQEGNKKYF